MFEWLALAVSCIILLRGIGTPCPNPVLAPFWSVSALELADSFEATGPHSICGVCVFSLPSAHKCGPQQVFCLLGSPAADAAVYGMMREDRRGALPWVSMVRCFALLSAVLRQEMSRLRSSHLVDDVVRRHERLLVGRYGPLSDWSPLPPDLAEQLADLQRRSREDSFSALPVASPDASNDIFTAYLDVQALASDAEDFELWDIVGLFGFVCFKVIPPGYPFGECGIRRVC